MCFNGAVTLSLQKYGNTEHSERSGEGFNGAVTLSLQKSVRNDIAKLFLKLLQWSCNFIVTEIIYVSLVIIASCMLQWSCNFIVTEIIQIWRNNNEILNASMEL